MVPNAAHSVGAVNRGRLPTPTFRFRPTLTTCACTNQVVDTGLDYSSCFFIDEDGVEVDHGHYFEEIAISSYASSFYLSDIEVATVFTGGDFRADMSRRKVSYGIGQCCIIHSALPCSRSYKR